jgi:hypothetical protein
MLNGVGDTVGTAAGKVGGTVGTAADKVGTAADKAKGPALVGTVAAASLVGGLALGSRVLSRGRRSKLHVPGLNGGGALKSVAHEFRSVGKEIGKSGFRLGVGDVDMSLQSGRKDKDNRDSPLEVVLDGLTRRRHKR